MKSDDRLYLIGLDDDLVKVGRTSNVQSRMKQHRGAFGERIKWTHIFAPGTGHEEYAIKAEFTTFSKRVGMTEVFSGLSREIAVEACRIWFEDSRAAREDSSQRCHLCNQTIPERRIRIKRKVAKLKEKP